jgi:alkanesulfonate monooxygenase SsuD/methylene tetrahydromethanopterin reductase-like flavin-dependent oxidoreductase (luciferase family)
MDLFEERLARVEHRLTQLVPPPVRKIPILVGGMGVKRTLPIVAKHADIWHTFASPGEYRRKNAMLKELVAQARGKLSGPSIGPDAKTPMRSFRRASPS